MKGWAGTHQGGRCRPPQAAMPLCSELMCRPKMAVVGSRPERTTPGGSSRTGRGRQYCKLRWLLSPSPEFSKCIFELKPPRPVIWQRLTSTNSCWHEPPLKQLVAVVAQLVSVRAKSRFSLASEGRYESSRAEQPLDEGTWPCWETGGSWRGAGGYRAAPYL